MHTRVVDQSGLVDVDIQTAVSLHLKGGLHTGGTEKGLRAVVAHIVGEVLLDFGQTADFVLILLGIVVARYPPGGAVLCHREFSEFLLDCKINKFLVCREFVSEAKAVLEEAETDIELAAAALLGKFHKEFVVVVADGRLLAPYRLPGFVEAVGGCSHELEVTVKHI